MARAGQAGKSAGVENDRTPAVALDSVDIGHDAVENNNIVRLRLLAIDGYRPVYWIVRTSAAAGAGRHGAGIEPKYTGRHAGRLGCK